MPHHRRCILAVGFFGLLGLSSPVAPTAEDTAVGYRGDGSGVFPNADPPVEWDEATGKNILWKTPLPNWGHSCPLAVRDRVFVTCEPGWKSDWPVLLCLNAQDGRVLWSRELNHLSVAVPDAAQREKAASAWHEFLAKWAKGYAAACLWRTGDKDAKETAQKQFNALGINARGGGNYSGGEFKAPLDKPTGDLFKKAGLQGETWREGGALGTHCVGQSFGTPVSDGESVFVPTAFGGFFCFDLDGNLKWQKFYPGQPGEYCRNGRSPLLYKDLLLSDVTALARGIDKQTGALKWSAPVDTETILTPVIVTVNGTAVLLCFNAKAFRLPDGKPLTVTGWKDFGATALVKHDERDVVFFSGGGEHGGWEKKGDCPTPPPAAVRFSLDGDALKGQVLWNGIEGVKVNSHTQIVYHDGKLYHGVGLVLDALTGKRVLGPALPGGRGRIPPEQRAVPETTHLLSIAGGHLYGLANSKGKDKGAAPFGVGYVYSLDGKKLAANKLLCAAPEGEKRAQVAQADGNAQWQDFNYGCPYTIAGDRLYIRSNDLLYCIGKK